MKTSHIIIGGAIAYLLLRGNLLRMGFKNVAELVQMRVAGIDWPRKSHVDGALVLPLNVAVDNNLPQTINIDKLFIQVFREENKNYRLIAVSQPDLTKVVLAQNATSLINLELKSDFFTVGTELFDIAKDKLAGNKVTMLIKSTATVYGQLVQLPDYTYTL